MAQFGQGSRKRGRSEEDEQDHQRIQFEGVPKRQRNSLLEMPFFDTSDGHRSAPMQRARTLPFRIEHPQALPPPAPTFESTEGDSPSASDPSGGNSPASFRSLPALSELPDMDMNMIDEVGIVGSASPPSPFQQHMWMRPAKLNSPSLHDQFSGGRIPTPIHSNFVIGAPPRTVGGNNKQPDGDSDIRSSMLAPPRQRPHLMENDYRMPSPISEDHMETPADLTSSQLSRLSFSVEDNMELDAAAIPVPDTPTRMGRARSGAITACGQEKKKFVVGFREDCEKCQARMPGHWAHFLPI